jgi:hypothetical protein
MQEALIYHIPLTNIINLILFIQVRRNATRLTPAAILRLQVLTTLDAYTILELPDKSDRSVIEEEIKPDMPLYFTSFN